MKHYFLLLIFTLFFSDLALAQEGEVKDVLKLEAEQEPEEREAVVFGNPCIDPYFLGDARGLIEKLSKEVNSSLRQLDTTVAPLQGKVYVKFKIDTLGKASNFEVIRGISPLIDSQVLTVFSKASLKFSPGAYYGKKVPSAMIFPILIRVFRDKDR